MRKYGRCLKIALLHFVRYHKCWTTMQQKNSKFKIIQLIFQLQIHELIKKTLDKETGATHPVIKSIHLAIQKIPGIPKWSERTTLKMMQHLGFAYVIIILFEAYMCRSRVHLRQNCYTFQKFLYLYQGPWPLSFAFLKLVPSVKVSNPLI